MLNDWCQQFPSHSGGGLAFDSDGDLYVSGGRRGELRRHGLRQLGRHPPELANPVTPVNPCGDPVDITSAPGDPTTFDPTDAEGGMLRAQDVRTTGRPDRPRRRR